MNVYTRITGRGALLTLLLMTTFFAGEIWLMSKLPKLNPYVLHAATIVLFLLTLRAIFDRRSKSISSDSSQTSGSPQTADKSAYTRPPNC